MIKKINLCTYAGSVHLREIQQKFLFLFSPVLLFTANITTISMQVFTLYFSKMSKYIIFSQVIMHK